MALKIPTTGNFLTVQCNVEIEKLYTTVLLQARSSTSCFCQMACTLLTTLDPRVSKIFCNVMLLLLTLPRWTKYSSRICNYWWPGRMLQTRFTIQNWKFRLEFLKWNFKARKKPLRKVRKENPLCKVRLTMISLLPELKIKTSVNLKSRLPLLGIVSCNSGNFHIFTHLKNKWLAF